jgi:GNAT superfamily N-acetyltransferase
MALSTSIGWLHTLEDWTTILDAGRVVGHRDSAGAPISSAALFDYGDSLLSIGMVLVAPSHRRRGLARAVMDRCLSMAGRRPTMLIATAMGEPLYVDLGFTEVGRVTRMACEGAAAGAERAVRGERLPSISAADVQAVLEIDRTACGADRSVLLRSLLTRAAATAVVRGGSGGIRGFGIALRQRDHLTVAPLVAPSTPDAITLFQSLAGGEAGPVRLDVPADREAYLSALAGHGLTRGPSAPIMLLGAGGLPGRREQIHAIASRGFG